MAEMVFSQGELEAIATALGDTSEGLTGSEIGHLLASIKMIDPTPTSTKWVRLHNAFVERQNRAQNRRAILEFMRQAMLPARHVKRPERFEPMRANLNRALAFSGLAVDAAGELVATDQVKTLPEAARRADELRADLVRRGVHADVLRFCRAELVADNYFHAVLEASKSIADKLRTRTGLADDGGDGNHHQQRQPCELDRPAAHAAAPASACNRLLTLPVRSVNCDRSSGDSAARASSTVATATCHMSAWARRASDVRNRRLIRRST